VSSTTIAGTAYSWADRLTWGSSIVWGDAYTSALTFANAVPVQPE